MIPIGKNIGLYTLFSVLSCDTDVTDEIYSNTGIDIILEFGIQGRSVGDKINDSNMLGM